MTARLSMTIAAIASLVLSPAPLSAAGARPLPGKQGATANALEGVKWQGRYVNHLGAIKTCLDYLDVKISRGWLYGGTAHAFVINLRETVCVSGPTAWNTQMLFDLAPNLGYKVEGIKISKKKAGDAFHAKQREAWDMVRKSIDAGFPCYGFELRHPDFYVVYGYEDGHYLFDGWAKGRLSWQRLGAFDVCVLEMYSVKPCEPAPADKVVKDALAAAIKHAENPGDWVMPRYQSGPTAFDLWAEELESGRAIHDSHCYNAVFWHECREMAVEFLKEARQRLPGRCDEAFDEAIAHYTVVRDNLKKLAELHPERKNRNWQDKLKSPEGAELLLGAAAAEYEGLLSLERIVAKLAANAGIVLQKKTAEGERMKPTSSRLETERLVIRRFTEDDWAEIQKLAVNKESSEFGKYDHRWPTSEEGCKGMAGYLSKSESYWAVCLRDGGRIIGLLALNDIDEHGALDLGHIFHTDFVSGDHDTEALRCIMDYAFTNLDIQSIYCNNAEEWAVQLAPLKKLGLKLKPRPEGAAQKSSFQKDEDGKPIEFVGCRMAITKEEWLRRVRKGEQEND